MLPGRLAQYRPSFGVQSEKTSLCPSLRKPVSQKYAKLQGSRRSLDPGVPCPTIPPTKQARGTINFAREPTGRSGRSTVGRCEVVRTLMALDFSSQTSNCRPLCLLGPRQEVLFVWTAKAVVGRGALRLRQMEGVGPRGSSFMIDFHIL